MAALMMSLSNINRVTKKLSYKQNRIHFDHIRDFEIVFILLIKVKTFYIKLISICFEGPSLKGLFL